MGIFNQFTADGLRAHAIASGYREQYNEALWDWLTASGYTQPDLNGKIAAAIAAGFDFSTFASAWSPSALFASSEVGVWYDPSDLSTMFQESTGITPAAVGQPVGLLLDKSKGLVLGPELVTNGGFDNDTVWTKGVGVTITDGTAVFTNVAANQDSLYQTCMVVDKVYVFTYTVSNYVSGSVRMNNGSYIGPARTTNGTYTETIKTSSGNIVFKAAAAGTTLSLDNISVKELPGNHATQATAASRPILRESGGLYYLEFDGTDDCLFTSEINFTSTDKMTAVVGCRILNNVLGLLYETSTTANSNIGAFNAYVNDAGGFSLVSRANKAGGPTGPAEVAIGVANTSVWSIDYDFARTTGGTAIYQRRNNAAQSNGGTFTVGSGNFGNYPLYIGRRGATSLPFRGHIYGMVIRGAQSTTDDIEKTEKYLGGKAGV